MNYATCINEAAYSTALTYGRRYAVLGYTPDAAAPRNIEIRADTGRVRQFPASCFDLTGADIPMLHTIHIRDPFIDTPAAAIEVDLVLSDNQRRWCFFATPQALLAFGEVVDGTNVRMHSGTPHMIIVSIISPHIIEQTLRYIERQGRLFACTKVIDVCK